MRGAALLVLFVPLGLPPAQACECANYTPIQRSARRYAETAVFKARVFRLMGEVSVQDGKRYSNRVLAVVRHRYWGLPWYWPPVVILDGRDVCGRSMREDEEYLVSGIRGRYGVLHVGFCGRTRPLPEAQVDLRTLDGSRCTAPGGTIIGRVFQSPEGRPRSSPVPNAVLTFRDSHGMRYSAQSDQQGIYEIRHLPPGPYELESRLAPGRYALGGGYATAGVCSDSPVSVHQYVITGQLIPGIDRYARVDLIGIHEERASVTTATIAPDGRFYFETVPPGEYYLVATIELVGRYPEQARVFYPGATSRERAVKVRVSGAPHGRSLDFDPGALPIVPIPVVVESPGRSHPIPVGIVSRNRSGEMAVAFRSHTGVLARVFGMRGQSFGVSATAHGYGHEEGVIHRAETIWVTAAPKMAPVRIVLHSSERR